MKLSTLIAATAGFTVLAGAGAALADDASAANPTAMQMQGRAGAMGDMPMGVAATAQDASGAAPAITYGPRTGQAPNASSAGINASALATDIPGLPSMTPQGNPILYGSSPGTFQPATTVSMAPVPDTAANRAAYGGPDSHGGRATSAAGN